VNVLIAVAGVIGLGVAAFFFVDLVVDAGRRRQYLDIAIAAAIAAFTVWLLFTFGDRLLQ
jgi:hypothetical protein